LKSSYNLLLALKKYRYNTSTSSLNAYSTADVKLGASLPEMKTTTYYADYVSPSVMSQFDKKAIDTVGLVKRYLSAESSLKSSNASVGFTLSNYYSASELSTGLSALKGVDFELLKGLPKLRRNSSSTSGVW
jgi:hypothetical protein